jgi:hypothetical protein
MLYRSLASNEKLNENPSNGDAFGKKYRVPAGALIYPDVKVIANWQPSQNFVGVSAFGSQTNQHNGVQNSMLM